MMRECLVRMGNALHRVVNDPPTTSPFDLVCGTQVEMPWSWSWWTPNTDTSAMCAECAERGFFRERVLPTLTMEQRRYALECVECGGEIVGTSYHGRCPACARHKYAEVVR